MDWPRPTVDALLHSTFVPDVQLPRATSDPTRCPNQVLVQLTTTLLIPNYNRFYTTPIRDFNPNYLPLADGSLITKPFIDDLFNSNISLLVMGILTMLFARNIFVSGDYLRRATIKDNSLFKVLFTSQLLALVAFIPMIISQFSQSPNCRVVNIVSYVATDVSLALLITWILGYKAYRCLSDSRFVLVSLALFLCGSTAVSILDMLGLQAERRLSGGCLRTSDLFFIRIYIVLQLVQSFFICCCFFYAVYRSHGSPLARGRISLRLSMTDSASHGDANNRQHSALSQEEEQSVPSSQNSSFIASFISKIFNQHNSQPRLLRKPSVGTPPRPSVVRISEAAHSRSVSPAPSSHSRLSRYIPRMELFRDVMRDELCYTTFITASCVVLSVLMLIGVNLRNELTVSGWISLNWSIISVLAIHSFGRVIRRHERDLILQEPGSWQSSRINHTFGPRTRHSHSSCSPSHRRQWRKANDFDDQSDPFSETRGLNESRGSWSSYSSDLSSHREEQDTFNLPAVPAALVLEKNTDRQIQSGWTFVSDSPKSPTLFEEKSCRDSVS